MNAITGSLETSKTLFKYYDFERGYFFYLLPTILMIQNLLFFIQLLGQIQGIPVAFCIFNITSLWCGCKFSTNRISSAISATIFYTKGQLIALFVNEKRTSCLQCLNQANVQP